MGFNGVWVATRGISEARLLERLGMRRTGRSVEPGRDVCGIGRSSRGWLLVAGRYYSEYHEFAAKSWPSKVEMCVGEVCEGGGYMGCWFLRGGWPAWSVVYDLASSTDMLMVKGVPPDPYLEIKQRHDLEKDLRGVTFEDTSIMEIPREMIFAKTGWALGRYGPRQPPDPEWEELVPIQAD